MTELTLRVQRVRARTARATTFSGLSLGGDGQAIPRAPRYAVTVPAKLATVQIEQGQWWRLKGKPAPFEYTVDGYRVTEYRFVAIEAQLLRPSGEHIVQLLSTSPVFPGVGDVKARRLWEKLGEALYDALDSADHKTLADVVGAELADTLVGGWQTYGNADAIRLFQRIGLDLRVSRKLWTIHGMQALEALESDPYRLLSFGMTWAAVDALALNHFLLVLDDPRRLGAAIESVLYSAFDAGHTFCQRSAVLSGVARLVGKAHAEDALTFAQTNHLLHVSGEQLHALGPFIIENHVAAALAVLLRASQPLASAQEVESFIEEFEIDEAMALGQAHFTLNEAQRQAVIAASAHPLVLITGGAGVGKTTVLKAVCQMLERVGQTIYPMALAGRAAKRMSEATGRPAMTIAGFLRNVAPLGVPDSSVLLVDEASMLDILLAYRLTGVIQPTSRIILIGDPFQLPPVGPGLTLHALVPVAEVPRIELSEVRRFGGDIAVVAKNLRDGIWPTFAQNSEAAVAFLSCAPTEIADMVLKHYLSAPSDTQILTFTRTHGEASTRALNAACQGAITPPARQLLVRSGARDRIEDTGLRVGDPVLCTRNLWGHGLQNGSLGRLESIEDAPVPTVNTDGTPPGEVLAWVRWDDGQRRPVTDEVLDALELGYAITVHKAQGSQFKRVIIAVTQTFNLDRTMLYTALTRAKSQVLLIGDPLVARRAVEAPPHAALRNVALGEMLARCLEAT